MLKRLTLVMAMIAFLSSSVFAQSYRSSETAAPTKTVKTKTAKKVTATKKSTPKHHVASKKSKKKSSKVA